jgi:hypothetical protein
VSHVQLVIRVEMLNRLKFVTQIPLVMQVELVLELRTPVIFKLVRGGENSNTINSLHPSC